MRQTTVTVSAEIDKAARIEGAQQLGVQPDEVTVVQVDETTYAVSIKNAPGQFDIAVWEDKMGAAIETITPPLGNGKPLTVEDIEHALADLNIVVGINKEVIENIVSEVVDTGTPLNNIQVAAGEPAKSGKDGRIELKIGRGAVNKDPNANSMVKTDQIVAVRIPGTKGMPGRNIFGEKVPAKDGKDVNFAAGDNVIITEDGSTFIAALYGKARSTSKDVSVTNLVKVNKPGMWAKMSIFPTLADNSKLAFEDVCETLKQTGVVHGIKEDLIKKVIEAGEPARNLTVAEATPAKDGVDARIEFKFQLNGDDPETVDAARRDGKLHASTVLKEMFAAGDVLAIKIPMEEPVKGSTVAGDTLTGAEPKDKQVTAGTNVAVLNDGLTYVVAEDVTVSYADYVDGRLCADEPLLVSEDKLNVYLSVHPPSESGRMLTMELVEKLLSDCGIIQGIDLDPVKQVLSEVASENMPIHDVVVAKGTASERGEDARIEFKFQAEKIAGAIDDRFGRIDYKKRGSIQSVKAGGILAVKTPLTHGKEGVNVFGDIISAEPGADKVLSPTGNVEVSDDGLVFTSEIDGMVILARDNKIGVFKQYEVPGDVDYSTGNLSMDGSLDIKGWIRSGFDVRASGDIKVGGGIEDSIVKAGGDIYIQGGIIGSGEGRVHADGNLTARFFENARVHADGNIFVREDIMRSTVSAKGSIIVTEGKGRIKGGSVEAVKGIEANEIGSDAGVKTRVSVGTESKIRKSLADATKRLADFKRKRDKIDMVLARYVKKYKNKALPKETTRKLDKLVKLRREMVRNETGMTKYRKELAQKMSETVVEPVAVKVKKDVYFGTTVVVCGYVYHVTEDIRGKVMFVLNAEQQSIELVG
jgi:hypothetical protein